MRHKLTQPAHKRSILACAFLVVLGATYLAQLRAHARRHSQALVCQCNLRELEAMEEQWASDHHREQDAVPRQEDLRGYSKGFPTCPARGTYLLGPVGSPPRCTLGDGGTSEAGDDHVLHPAIVRQPEGRPAPSSLRKQASDRFVRVTQRTPL